MAAPTYPSSGDVVSGQATLAAHYNTLRADAIRAGATAANAVGFGVLLQDYSHHVQLEYLASNRVRVPYSLDAIPVLVIDGYMLALPTHCDLAEAYVGGAGVVYVFANRSAGSTAFTLSVNSSPIEAEDQRLIGEYYWTGANIRTGSIKSYETTITSNLLSGLYAQRSGSPAAGDMYIATDTSQVLVCFSAGVWTALKFGFYNDAADGFYITGGTTPREFTLTGGDLYIDMPAAGASVVFPYNGEAAMIGSAGSTKMTKGLTINQGAADDEIIDLKSSDVDHGITDLAETDTYGVFAKASVASGGLSIGGYTEDIFGLHLSGRYTNDDATKSTAGVGAVIIDGRKKNGTTVGAPGANANLVVVRSNTTTRFILDADGDSHQDVGTAWTNFDDYDDAGLLTDLSLAVSRPDDPIREGFGEFLKYNRAALERARLVTFNDDGHHFVNMSKLAMLLTGAVRQQAEALREQKGRLAKMERALLLKRASGMNILPKHRRESLFRRLIRRKLRATQRKLR
jgi:hypothetical protein